MNKSTIKTKIFDNKIFRGVKSHKMRPWKSYWLFVLFNSSLLVFSVAINSNARTFAQEAISSDRDLIYTYAKLDEWKLLPDATIAATKFSNPSPSLLPMNVGVKGYEQQLQEIISRGLNSQSLALAVSNSNEPTAIIVSDGQQLPQQQISSVAKLDTQINGLSQSSLSDGWSQVVASMFVQAKQESQSAYISHQLLLIGNTLLGMMLFCCLFLIWQHLKTQKEQFTLQNPKLVFPQAENFESNPINAPSSIEQRTIEEKQKNLNVPQRKRLQIGNAIIWLVGLSSMFYFWVVS